MSLPPTHKAPHILQLAQWILRPLNWLESCQRRYGDCFRAEFGVDRHFYFLSDPKAIEQVLAANPAYFDAGRANWVLRRTVGDNSLLLLDGDRHQRHRQLLMPPFHGERMKAYGELICRLTEQVTSQWPINQPFATRPEMQKISLSIILQAVFGLTEGPRCDRLRGVLDALLKVTTAPFGFAMAFFPILQRDYGAWSPGAQFKRLMHQIDTEIYAEIRERRDSLDPTRTDILTLLLMARDEAGQPMTDLELRDELVTLLLAGHETTATAITWAIYWIHFLPSVKAKLLAELESLEERPDLGAIVRLPYLNAVCCETLRIYPVAIITSPRILKVPLEVGGYQFEPEAILAPCIYLVHQRPDLFPDPKTFKPERFLERQFSPYEYFPFGGSNRRCIGAAFALYEMKLVLATLLTRYELALAETKPVVPIRRGVTTAPKGGVKLIAKGQRPAVSTSIASLCQT
jgi:unspecific monooxygenase